MIIRRKLLAFVHMERAAGTTLNYILRRNFLLRYVDVRPFSTGSERIFTPRDLTRMLRINPALACISGHSVVPWANLETVAPNIRYITMLRDPVARYVSHYLYWIERKKIDIAFERFLELDRWHNLQTKRIGGGEDLDKARDRLDKNFLAVGILPKYDEFLVILRDRLQPAGFDPRYVRRNATIQPTTKDRILRQYEDEIIKRNALDIELYQWVCDHILPKQSSSYGPDLQKDVDEFVKARTQTRPCMYKSYVDYAARKLYFNPAIGIRRMLGGLPYTGSY